MMASLLEYSTMPIKEVFEKLNTSEQGLDKKSVRKKIETYGLNEVAQEKTPNGFILFLKNFKNPFVVLLLVLGVVSYFVGELDAVFIIFSMVLLSVLMRFIQEYRSNTAAEKLKKLVSTSATVKRDSSVLLYSDPTREMVVH